MKIGKVIKAFPFAVDGFSVSHLSAGADFPPLGASVGDNIFDGLVAAGYVEASKVAELPPEEDLNRRIIETIDRRLSLASDQELKDIIARSGTPFSGNMVHAHLVFAAKQQLQAEMDGAAPVRFVDPNSGVTEQPLAAPGAPTPPSASAAVEQQKAQQEAGEKAAAGENKATNQFGDPLPAGKTKEAEVDLDGLKKDELEEVAKQRGIDVSAAKNKAEIIDLIKAGKSA